MYAINVVEIDSVIIIFYINSHRTWKVQLKGHTSRREISTKNGRSRFCAAVAMGVPGSKPGRAEYVSPYLYICIT